MLRVSGGIRRFVLPGKIFWANEADIAPEWLYDNGVSCCPKKNSHLPTRAQNIAPLQAVNQCFIWWCSRKPAATMSPTAGVNRQWQTTRT